MCPVYALPQNLHAFKKKLHPARKFFREKKRAKNGHKKTDVKNTLFGSFTETKKRARFLGETQQLCRKNKKLYCFLHLATKTNEKKLVQRFA